MSEGPDIPPVVVGGCGGSGTRVVAQLLMESGIHLGSALNEARDNLLAVLLFNRRSVLTDTPEEFRSLLDMFRRRMRGETVFTSGEIARLEAIAKKPRLQHSPALLEEWMQRFLKPDDAPVPGGAWGWKVPTSHIILPRLLEADPSIRYIHLVRHGLDMAFGHNHNQFNTWGPVLLDRPVRGTPRQILLYWCEVQERVRRIGTEYPGTVLHVRFEDLCADPVGTGRTILAFLGHEAPDRALSEFAGYVRAPSTSGRYRSQDLSEFTASDLGRLEAEGYAAGG